MRSIKQNPSGDVSQTDERKRWDSNPRTVARHLISSQGRYDHFDTLPNMRLNSSIIASRGFLVKCFSVKDRVKRLWGIG